MGGRISKFSFIYSSSDSVWSLSSLVAQLVKNPPAIQETWVRSLGWDDPPGKGYPLQYSCLENPVDRGAWWATVCGAAKSQTRLTNTGTFKVSSHTSLLSPKAQGETIPGLKQAGTSQTTEKAEK